jgi:hypothetical protein
MKCRYCSNYCDEAYTLDMCHDCLQELLDKYNNRCPTITVTKGKDASTAEVRK